VLLVELAELLVRLSALVFAEERMPSKVCLLWQMPRQRCDARSVQSMERSAQPPHAPFGPRPPSKSSVAVKRSAP
jgi:hypothetical protein